MFILDTDHLTYLERGGHPIAERILKRMRLIPDECFATVISYEEQTRGWLNVLAKAKTLTHQVEAYRKLLGQLRNYCEMKILEFDESAATEFQTLRNQKIRIPTMDLKIAAIVQSHHATLATCNTRDFIKVPGLRFEDWTKE